MDKETDLNGITMLVTNILSSQEPDSHPLMSERGRRPEEASRPRDQAQAEAAQR